MPQLEFQTNQINLLTIGSILIFLFLFLLILRRRRNLHRQPQITKLNDPIENTTMVLSIRRIYLSDEEGNFIPLNLPASIGRGKENDLQVADDAVSIEHARIYQEKLTGAVVIEDLDSKNGLYLDGLPTVKNVLFDGHEIKLGNSVFQYFTIID